MKPLRHQDYANWSPAFGKTVMVWDENYMFEPSEMAHVEYINNKKTECLECGRKDVELYKLTTDTPNFLSDERFCMCKPCLNKVYEIVFEEGMTVEERCYRILQNSNYIINPEEDPAQIIESFCEASVGCPWLHPMNETEDRQFETQFKGYFEQFHAENIDLALNNKPVIDEKTEPFEDVGLHTMDDFGFEGQIMSDGSFWRIIDDYICPDCAEFKLCMRADCKMGHCSECQKRKSESDF